MIKSLLSLKHLSLTIGKMINSLLMRNQMVSSKKCIVKLSTKKVNHTKMELKVLDLTMVKLPKPKLQLIALV